ncbi:cathepsin L-like peptidase [Chironomus tepperi]|uniref:cathepsin L-like peptidase n=1 Tax=Chironomus tepperi TaxID=113505 RepID=UPI00391F3731
MELKFVIFLLILINNFSIIMSASMPDTEEDQVFAEYMNKFKIRLRKTANEVDKVRNNVIGKYRMIKRHNERFRKGKEKFEMELNKLSYLSFEELKKSTLGFRGNETSPYASKAIVVQPISKTSRTRREAPLPEYWNWNDKGIVRPVQDQGTCSSCYAFAAIGAIEAAACKTLGQCQKLSEQEAMECTDLCSGGWDDAVYTYSISTGGCTSSNYAYYGYKRQECSTSKLRKRITNTKVKGWYLLPNDEETIRTYLYNVGPAFVSFYLYENFYNFKSGIYSSYEGEYAGAHAVLLTGYGTENGTDYWIMRNSWGVEFGERGYFRMQRGINLCNVEGWKVTIPIV